MKVALLPLLLLTVLTGLIDAFSYMELGHVFVANMTGNVIFLALSLAGASGFSPSASLLAIGAFLLGAFIGGLLGSRLSSQPERLLSLGVALQTLFVGSSLLLLLLVGHTSLSSEYHSVLIIVLSIAMGLQNAVARKLAVPDLTTTVLTLTLVGIGADSRLIGGGGSKMGRRLLVVGAMFLGASGGGWLIFQVSSLAPLTVALVLLAFVAGMARSWDVTTGQQSRQEQGGLPVTQELVSQLPLLRREGAEALHVLITK